MKICHLSDIHWRSLTRHDEFRRAFTKMFDELKDIKPDAIVVCGDIVHSKTQGISPEIIEQLTWWFNSLASISEVHVILGNHDGNLMNPHRQDAISPILNAIGNKSIKLYKNSGVYKFKQGINFCVFSCFDEAGWSNVKPVENELNIALFHGSVGGSSTDQGWQLDADVKVSFFEPYDFAFLGDIHLKQFLAFRNEKPWIAYPGSTIMQSYGEQPGKGYLLWRINSRDDFDVEFKQVEHDQEFRTVDWKGSLRKTITYASQLPRGSRIRIRSDTLIPQHEIKQLTTELIALHGATEVVFKDDYVVDSKLIDTKTIAMEKQDLRDANSIMKLFKGFFAKDTFTDEEWVKVKLLIEKYVQRAIAEDNSARNVKWSLKDLSFDNTFGYGKDNRINFKHLSGITGIFGPNRAGKSSVIGTLLYALFNGSDRGAIKNLHIVNSRKTYCKAKLLLEIANKDYFLERMTVKNESNGVTHAVTQLNFAEINSSGDVIKDLNGEQRTDTEKTIRSLIGNSEDYMLTAVSAQGDINRFIDAGSAYRDRVMSRFLDLDIFEKMAQYVKEESSLIKAMVKNAPDKDWDTLIISKGAELQNSVSEIARLERLLKEKRDVLDALRVELAKSGMVDVITPQDVDALKNSLSLNRTIVNDLSIQLKKQNKNLEEINSQIVKNDADALSIPVDDLKKNLKAIVEIKESISHLKQNYEKEKQILKSQKNSVLKLADVPCGDQYPRCKYISDAHIDKSKLNAQETKVNEFLSKISNAENSLSVLNAGNIEKQLERFDFLTKERHQLSVKFINAKKMLEDIERKIENLEDIIAKDEVKLIDYVSRVVDVNISPSIKKEISLVQAQIDDLDTKRVRLASKKGSLITEIKSVQDEKEKFKILKSDWRVFELFLSAVSKKGIPSQIVQAQLPLINSEIARILHGVVDYTLRFEKDEESNTTEIYIDYGDSARLIELSSGMEKMIASLAIRVALQNASTLPRPDFIIIDEGFGSLDETNAEACNRLLVSLKKWFKNVIIISHVDAIKDVADNVIEITREGKDSHVDVE